MAALPRRATFAGAAVSVVALALAGCSSDDAGGSGGDGTGPARVVASTNVWGSVVTAVGGAAVEVQTLVDDPAADPHSYESTPQDAADVSDADLVVFNGGGYDEWMPQILETTGSGERSVETFALLGEQPQQPAEPEPPAAAGAPAEAEEGANEHVWYDLETVQAVASTIAQRLGELRPDQAQTFTANADRFAQRLGELSGQVTQIGQRNPAAAVALTEPLAVYLVEDAGLRDVTPPEFLEAVEEETDPPAAAVAATNQLVSGRQVATLIYNPQTETPVTQGVRTAAEQAGVPVVEMTETLPPGADYLTWMSNQVQALSQALPAR